MRVKRAIIAGQISLELTPDLSSSASEPFNILQQPGQRIPTGKMALGVDGAAARTGMALYQLGLPVHLIAKVGADRFGQAVQDSLRDQSPELLAGLVVDPSTATGFTLTLDPPGGGPTALTFPGSNDTFYASDIPRAALREADLFHFSDPAQMRSIYRGAGGELVSILQRARREGLTTSLDISQPDLTGPAGKADWPLVLADSLPVADLFLSDLPALNFLLGQAGAPQDATPALLHALSDLVLGYGVKAVVIRLDAQGLYLRTAPAAAWQKAGRALEGLAEAWQGQELWAPAFTSDTTNAHPDQASAAGFLSSILRGADPGVAVKMAAAAAAADELLPWDTLWEKVAAGWVTLPLAVNAAGWRKEEHDLWRNA